MISDLQQRPRLTFWKRHSNDLHTNAITFIFWKLQNLKQASLNEAGAFDRSNI